MLSRLKFVVVCLISLAFLPAQFFAYGAGVAKTKNIQDEGVPFVRVVIDGGLMNPVLGIGGNIEFPNLFGFLSIGGSCYYSPDIMELEAETNIGGLDYYSDSAGILGGSGLYFGVKLGWVVSQSKAEETAAIPVGSGAWSYLSYSYPEEVPVYYRHLMVAELTFENFGSKAISYNYFEGEDRYYVSLDSRPLLKLMYQFEYISRYRVDYIYALTGTDSVREGTVSKDYYIKAFVGPMATPDLGGLGGYCGLELGDDHLYTRVEIGGLKFDNHPVYMPFKCNVGFYF